MTTTCFQFLRFTGPGFPSCRSLLFNARSANALRRHSLTVCVEQFSRSSQNFPPMKSSYASMWARVKSSRRSERFKGREFILVGVILSVFLLFPLLTKSIPSLSDGFYSFSFLGEFSDINSELEQWKRPSFVQRRLRIFVYDIPTKFNKDILDKSISRPGPIRDPRCDQNFYSAEYHIHQYLLRSPARTMDPSEADFFYVPVYTTCDLIQNPPNNPARTGKNFADAVQYVRQKYPYYNATSGRNHVYMFSQGFAARLAGDWQKFKNGIFMVHNGEFTAPEYTMHKDFVVPPELRFYFTPFWSNKTLVERPFSPKYLAHFGGQIVDASVSDHRGSNYSGGVRQLIRAKFSGNKEYRITLARVNSYINDMMSSKFCFAPEGWHPWSPRPYYSVLLGCIPVIISEKQELAFEEFVAWDKFTVWVHPDDIHSIDKILRSFSDKDIARRRSEIQKIWRVFWYDEGGLGYEAILKALYDRKTQSRPHRLFTTVSNDAVVSAP